MATSNRWKKYGVSRSISARLGDEYRDNICHYPPYSSLGRGRKLLVFKTQVKARQSYRVFAFLAFFSCTEWTIAIRERLKKLIDCVAISLGLQS
jgi:hypothetical protein